MCETHYGEYGKGRLRPDFTKLSREKEGVLLSSATAWNPLMADNNVKKKLIIKYSKKEFPLPYSSFEEKNCNDFQMHAVKFAKVYSYFVRKMPRSR